MTASKVYEALLRLQDRFECVPIFLTSRGTWLTGEAVRDVLAIDAEIRRLADSGLQVGSGDRAKIDAEKLRLNKERYAPQLQNLDRGLEAKGVEPLFLAPDPSVDSLVSGQERRAWFAKQLRPKIDVAFPVVHGTHGEDGTLQGLFELADLPYVGAGVVASAVGMDKIVSKLVFRGAGLPVIDGLAFTRRQILEDDGNIIRALESALRYPIIVKPATAGSSIGIGLAKDASEALVALRASMRYSQRVLVERAIENRIEVQCGVLGNQSPTVSECEELIRSGPIVSYQEKYSDNTRPGGADLAPSIIPARLSQALTEEVRHLAAEAFKAIDSRGISRVDFLIDRATMKPFVNEINTMPGSVSFALWEASGVKPAELVCRLIELALEAHQEKSVTQFESKEGRALVDRRHLMTPGK
jgi:D-alanine-D-alanine ligase